MDRYIEVGGRWLRCGYTTGSCVTLATKAGLMTLMGQGIQDMVEIMTPKGWLVDVPVTYEKVSNTSVTCYVIKDGGDDPDVTTGLRIYSKVTLTNDGQISIQGGQGIGVVTKKGLAVEVGQWAINPVPMKMMRQEIDKLLPKGQGVRVDLYVPEGERVAQKTFNPKLGIVGGISIIGTSGIVEPMSEDALIETLRVEINMLAAHGHRDLLFVFGNYGRDFILNRLDREDENGLPLQRISNFVERAITFAGQSGIKRILLVGHAGKLVKVAVGQKNTHSKYGDRRMEAIVKSSRNVGLSKETIDRVLAANTTEEAMDVLASVDKLDQVMDQCAKDAKNHAETFADYQLEVECMIFSSVRGLLAATDGAKDLLQVLQGKEPSND